MLNEASEGLSLEIKRFGLGEDLALDLTCTLEDFLRLVGDRDDSGLAAIGFDVVAIGLDGLRRATPSSVGVADVGAYSAGHCLV